MLFISQFLPLLLFPIDAIFSTMNVSVTAAGERSHSSSCVSKQFGNGLLSYIYKVLMEDPEEEEEDGPGDAVVAGLRGDELKHRLAAAERPFIEILATNVHTAVLPTLGRRKNVHEADDIEDGRSCKQPPRALTEAEEAALCGTFTSMSVSQSEYFSAGEHAPKEYSSRRKRRNGGRGGRRQPAVEVVDMRMLLTRCAQAVSLDDKRSAWEQLREIRLHSSPSGDAVQRLAHYMAEALQARLEGIAAGDPAAAKPAAASDVVVLQAWHRFFVAYPFMKIILYTSISTILNVAAGEAKLHVIHFSVGYDFQLPALLRMLAARPGGPPAVRVTSIDLPMPGLLPERRMQVNGRLLKEYAAEYGVPFQYKAIVAAFETVTVEQLEIEPDEAVVVDALQLGQVSDQAGDNGEDSPRDTVLKTVAKIRPRVFIHSIANAAFSSPVFVNRFRETLFHSWAKFEALEEAAPADADERAWVEREILGEHIMDLVACEGPARKERAETYRQWQGRNARAGLWQVPVGAAAVTKARRMIEMHYHKDFIVDVDRGWLLMGWKGRMLYALSTWVAAGDVDGSSSS